MLQKSISWHQKMLEGDAQKIINSAWLFLEKKWKYKKWGKKFFGKK